MNRQEVIEGLNAKIKALTAEVERGARTQVSFDIDLLQCAAMELQAPPPDRNPGPT